MFGSHRRLQTQGGVLVGTADCSKDSQKGGPLGLLQFLDQPHNLALLDIADLGTFTREQVVGGRPS